MEVLEFIKLLIFIGAFIYLTKLSFKALLHLQEKLDVIKFIIYLILNIGTFLITCDTLVDYVIEIPHTTTLDYSDVIFIDVKYSFINVYYTVNGSSVKEDGHLYTKKIHIRDLNISNEDNIITLAYQVKFLDLFFIGRVRERQYKIINIPNIKSIEYEIVNDFPIISKKDDYTNVSFQDICISNDSYQFNNETVKSLIDGDIMTWCQIPAKEGYTIQFYKSNNISFQRIYIRGGLLIDNIVIYTDDNIYYCNFPPFENANSIVVLNLQEPIISNTLVMQFYSNQDSYYISDIWIDNYID